MIYRQAKIVRAARAATCTFMEREEQADFFLIFSSLHCAIRFSTAIFWAFSPYREWYQWLQTLWKDASPHKKNHFVFLCDLLFTRAASSFVCTIPRHVTSRHAATVIVQCRCMHVFVVMCCSQLSCLFSRRGRRARYKIRLCI
jgi:hypothetical protein